MGEAKNRKQRFLVKHPSCCFCGGSNPATTIDHQPGRLFFNDKQYPRDFEFPACLECNSQTSDSEQLLRLFAIPAEFDERNREQWRKTVRFIKKTNPGLVEQMFPHTREKRHYFKQLGMTKGKGLLYSDIPMLHLDSDIWRIHFENVGRKLMLAAHYQCFGKPLSNIGEIWLIHKTNSNAEDYTKIFAELTSNLAVPMAQGRRIGNQFSLRWGVAPDKPVAAWAMHLHMKVFFYGVTIDEPDWLERSSEYMFGKRFKPFGT